MRNIKLILEYEGIRYHGWQRQGDLPTIQKILEECIGTITQENIRVIGSGRTDAGVHAIKQVANFTTNSSIGVRNLLNGINSILPWDIVVNELVDAEASFHARYSAKSKVYLYKIYNSPIRSALHRHYAWFVHERLDVGKMKEGALLLRGTFDFSSFCAANCGTRNPIRTVKNIDIETSQDGMINICIEADGFLKYMVRNMVGTLVDVGKGKTSLVDLAAIVEAKDRKRAGVTAPPHGLFLKEVKY